MNLLILCVSIIITCVSSDDSQRVHTAYAALQVFQWLLSSVIFLSIEVYWLYRMHQYSQTMIIQKRQPAILMVSITAYLCYVTLDNTMGTLTALNVVDTDSETTGRVLLGIFVCVTMPLYWVYLCYCCTRFWLLFYDINWTVSCGRDQWHSLITGTKTHGDWFLAHKSSYGSFRWLRPRVFGLIAFCCIYSLSLGVMVVVKHLPSIIVVMLLSLHVLCALIFCVRILRNIPAFDDHIGLREELRFCVWCFIAMVAIWMLFMTLWLAMSSHFGDDDAVHDLSKTACFVLIRVVMLLLNLKQTRWPLRRFQSVLREQDYSERKVMSLAHQNTIGIEERRTLTPRAITARSSTASMTRVRGESETLSGGGMCARSKMKRTLRDERVFSEFMTILLREYCAECLLSVIEFVQFREHLIRTLRAAECLPRTFSTPSAEEEADRVCAALWIHDELEDYFIELPDTDSFPRSGIVYRLHGDEGDVVEGNGGGNEEADECGHRLKRDSVSDEAYTVAEYKAIARKLWAKYVREGGDFEVNIGSLQRKRYHHLLGDEQRWMGNTEYEDWTKLVALFDPVVHEMAGLMTTAFLKWRSNPEDWRRVKKQIKA